MASKDEKKREEARRKDPQSTWGSTEERKAEWQEEVGEDIREEREKELEKLTDPKKAAPKREESKE